MFNNKPPRKSYSQRIEETLAIFTDTVAALENINTEMQNEANRNSDRIAELTTQNQQLTSSIHSNASIVSKINKIFLKDNDTE